MSPRYQAHASAVDLACDRFRRDMLELKAPTTWRLMRAVNDAMADMSFRHPLYAELDEQARQLSGDAEHGVERGAADVASVNELLAKVKEIA